MRPLSPHALPGLLILATLSLPVAAAAGPGVWTTTGPNAAVSTVVVDPSNPNVVYAGSFDFTRGLFRSGNRGQTWALDLSGVNVQALAVSGSPTVVYVGTENGVVKSENGGVNWSAANNGLTNLDITALAAGVSHSDIVYAGTRQGIFRSNNRGASWTSLGFGTEAVSALAVDPSNGNGVYAGISGNLLRSEDGGGTWVVTNAFPTPFSPTEAHRFLSIVVAPSDPTTLYASSCFCVGGGSYVFRSRDRGVTWAQTFYDPTAHALVDLAVSRSNPAVVYAAGQVTIYRSLDARLELGPLRHRAAGHDHSLGRDRRDEQPRVRRRRVLAARRHRRLQHRPRRSARRVCSRPAADLPPLGKIPGDAVRDRPAHGSRRHRTVHPPGRPARLLQPADLHR